MNLRALDLLNACTLERLKLQLQMLIGRWVGAMELVQRAELLGWFDRIQCLVLE